MTTYRVTDAPFCARGDGVTDDRAAIQAALDAAGNAGGGRVVLDAGRVFVTANLYLRSGVTLLFEEGATLKQAADRSAYVEQMADGTYRPHPAVPGHVIHPEREWDVGSYYNYPLLYAPEGTRDIAVCGRGFIEMVRGQSCDDTLHMHPIGLYRTERYTIEDITVRRYNTYAIIATDCAWGLYRGVTVQEATDSAGDGISMANCHHIRVTGCRLTTSDDGIVISSAYGDPRTSLWRNVDDPRPTHHIEIDHNHVEVTWDATKALALILWGHGYPDPRQVEMHDLYVHDNSFQTMGVWYGNWNVTTGLYDNNGSFSAAKNWRFERNEVGVIQDNFWALPVSDFVGYPSMREIRNGDFEEKGDLYWVSRAGGHAGASDDPVGQNGGWYGYIDRLEEADAALYQGLWLEAGRYRLTARLQSAGEPVRLFARDQATDEALALQPCAGTDWQTVSLTFTLPRSGGVRLGLERGEARRGWGRIDDMALEKLL